MRLNRAVAQAGEDGPLRARLWPAGPATSQGRAGGRRRSRRLARRVRGGCQRISPHVQKKRPLSDLGCASSFLTVHRAPVPRRLPGPALAPLYKYRTKTAPHRQNPPHIHFTWRRPPTRNDTPRPASTKDGIPRPLLFNTTLPLSLSSSLCSCTCALFRMRGCLCSFKRRPRRRSEYRGRAGAAGGTDASVQSVIASCAPTRP